MTTGYTPSLRLWQGQPLDQSIKGAWGPPLNLNDNLLEAAILGTSVVSLVGQNSPFTLPTANGAADQARSLVQQYTGALLADFTVVLPNVPKFGYARNSTTGGHNIILNAGAGTTVSIPPDNIWHFYWTDGATNVALPQVVFGVQVLGPINGTTGTFTGNVTMAGLTATSGHFTTTLQVDTTTTLIGAVTFGNVAVFNNSQNIFWKNSGGVNRPLITLAGSNVTLISSGGAGFQINNVAQSVGLFSMTDAGAATFAGSLASSSFSTGALSATAVNVTSLNASSNIATSATVFGVNGSFSGSVFSTSGYASNGAYRGTGFFVNATNQGYTGRDASNIDRTIMLLDSSNCTNIYNGGGLRTRFLNQAGSIEFVGIDNSGNVYFQAITGSPIAAGTSGMTYLQSGGLEIQNNGGGSTLRLGVTGGSLLAQFFANGSNSVGGIATNGVTTTYLTASDQALKLDDGLLVGATKILMKLRPRWFRWRSNPDGPSEPGFFAQQVARVFPWAVHKGNRRKNMPWMMDNAKLVPLLTAALQEQVARTTELERRLARLERAVS